MKKSMIVLASVLLAFSGCGRGWLPIFRGAPCLHGCNAAYTQTPAVNQVASDCGSCANGVVTGAAYGTSYGGIHEGGIVYDSAPISGYGYEDGYISGPTISSSEPTVSNP